MENFEKKADENLIALKRKDENNMTKNVIVSMIFSVTLLTGIMVCLICDIAISGHLTWAPIPVCSIVFAWVVSIPIIIFGKRGILISLISLSIFIVPYLFLLSRLTKTAEVFSIGTAMSIVSIVFLWLIFMIFNRLWKSRKAVALGIAFLSGIPFLFIVNSTLSKMISEPILDIWDILTVFILLILAFVSFIYDYAEKKGFIK